MLSRRVIRASAIATMSGKLLDMADDMEGLDGAHTPTGEGAGTAQMVALMTAELERLKVNLERVRSSDAPNRRALIKAHVERIDERQDALASLQALLNKAEASDQAKT